MRIFSFFIILLLSVFCSTAESAVIELKSGKIIEGNIVEKTDRYIKVDSGVGFSVTYYASEIQKIRIREDEVTDNLFFSQSQKNNSFPGSEEIEASVKGFFSKENQKKIKMVIQEKIQEIVLKINEIKSYIMMSQKPNLEKIEKKKIDMQEIGDKMAEEELEKIDAKVEKMIDEYKRM
ncbi:MAG: hypothetical protein P9M07_03105 [Candidatus Aceula meridiana]|nr:hypothetical protein [Candidatus Aceula meridiana]